MTTDIDTEVAEAKETLKECLKEVRRSLDDVEDAIGRHEWKLAARCLFSVMKCTIETLSLVIQLMLDD